MTDKEITIACANILGFKGEYDDECGWFKRSYITSKNLMIYSTFMPTEVMSDAMSLATELGMAIVISKTLTRVLSYNEDRTANIAIERFENHNGDKIAATCKAISVAAANVKMRTLTLVEK